MKSYELIQKIESDQFGEIFKTLYGVSSQKERYIKAINEFTKLYGSERDLSLFSVAGRSEISGNHTDHNYGRVIAASIDLDIIAVAAKSEKAIISIKSENFDVDNVDISSISIDKDSFYTSAAIIAGTCQGFMDRGYQIGGYDAYTTSSVLKGSGLSSSAAFEDMVGTILNYFYNNGGIDNTEIAKISQFAEREFFGKPCGLMDQTACAVGGFIAIDFKDPKSPVIEKLDFNLTNAGYSLCIVNTGGNHADLNEDYAAIPSEMKKIASFFGKDVLREITLDMLMPKVSELRNIAGDRAILRAIHFLNENDRVAMQTEALRNNNLSGFLNGVMDSGNSSFKYLQNVYTVKNVEEQGISLALALSEYKLKDKAAAWRVHGGGFAGTIQAFVRNEDLESFKIFIDNAFGKGACTTLKVRQLGAVCISN